jgi:hypothetical protein
LGGAELGPQLPLIQVLTPIRGSTQPMSMIHAAIIANGMKNSMMALPLLLFVDLE